MRTILTNILRTLWLLLLFGWGWNLASGKIVDPLHPFNIGLTAVIVVGGIMIWFSARAARIVAGICGVVAAHMLGFQALALMTILEDFPGDVQFSASYGPFEFDGIAAAITLWLHPLLLFGFSVELLVREIRDLGLKAKPSVGANRPSK